MMSRKRVNANSRTITIIAMIEAVELTVFTFLFSLVSVEQSSPEYK